MLPPTAVISKDVQADDCNPVKNDVPDEPPAIDILPSEPPANDKIAGEDLSYYFQDAIFLVSNYFSESLIGSNR
jgi:hypothetical protein